MNTNTVYNLAMPTPPTLIKLCYPLKQCKCVSLNSVPEYNQPYSDHLHVQILTFSYSVSPFVPIVCYCSTICKTHSISTSVVNGYKP